MELLDVRIPKEVVQGFDDGNAVYSFKGRTIDVSKPVYVYRNLHGKGVMRFSIKQGGRVVAHSDQLMLRDVKFIVYEAGRQRVIRTKHKNAHAFLRGFITGSGMGTTAARDGRLGLQVCYNPFKYGFFYYKVKEDKPHIHPVKGAMVVRIKNGVVEAAYGH